MSYRITWEPPNGFYAHFTGWVTPESAARLARELTADVRYDDLRYAIVDLTESPGHTFRRNDRHAVGMAMAEMIGARFSNQRVIEVHRVRLAHVELPRDVRAVLDPAFPGLRDPARGPRLAIAADDLTPSPAVLTMRHLATTTPMDFAEP